MDDMDAMKSESEKIGEIAKLALAVDVQLLHDARPDLAFVATVMDGWVSQMMRTTLMSVDAFLEYRAQLDAIVAEMGGDMMKKFATGGFV